MPRPPERLNLETTKRRRVDYPIFVIVATMLGIALVYLVILAIADSGIAAALPLLVGTLGAGALALFGWHRDREAAVSAAQQERRAHLHNRRLRRQLMQMHRAQDSLGDPDDVPAMILQIAITLLEAEKGMLLVPGEGGKLEMISALGFGESAEATHEMVEQAARQVLEEQRALRLSPPARRRGGQDMDIHSLVAVPVFVQEGLGGVVVCANRPGGFAEYDDDVLLALGDQAGAVLENNRLQEEMRDSYLAVVRLLSETIRVKDPALGSHGDEVSDYVVAVGRRLGLDSERRERLRFGSLLHDVGKIAISEQILLKPGPLSAEEEHIVQLHPRIGSRLVSEVSSLEPLSEAILHHHERFDGTGYPDGLGGEDIPLEARIISVADAFSAMTADRPYRKAMSVDEACAELDRCAGSDFDPNIASVFVEEVHRQPPRRFRRPLAAALSDGGELAEARARKGTPLGRNVA